MLLLASATAVDDYGSVPAGMRIRGRLPVGCGFTDGAPLFRVVHANFVEADTHD